ncbi:hypothetical protein GcM1_224062 [Golovinomyces cichoracearum]|uniref:Uncharacterized protein n=1 Tax=Golovinomyces cichoracearum TaxID=62708 RepID=A0A420IQS2_9PEZI|nr:hypothetical protein GcM1_224062 [Golovinomyces cichoracearum]
MERKTVIEEFKRRMQSLGKFFNSARIQHFITEFEGIHNESEVKILAENTDEIETLTTEMIFDDNTGDDHDIFMVTQYITSYGKVVERNTSSILRNQASFHALTRSNPNSSQAVKRRCP